MGVEFGCFSLANRVYLVKTGVLWGELEVQVMGILADVNVIRDKGFGALHLDHRVFGEKALRFSVDPIGMPCFCNRHSLWESYNIEMRSSLVWNVDLVNDKKLVIHPFGSTFKSTPKHV